MKYQLSILIIMLGSGIFLSSFGQSLTKEDRKKSLQLLNESFEKLQKLTKSLSEEQANYKPAKDRWSIKNNVDHLAKVEEIVWSIIQKSLQTPEEEQQTDIGDDEFIAKLSTREKKYTAPEVLKPEESKYESFIEALEDFQVKRYRTIKFLKKTKKNLRKHFAMNPVFGNLDTYQWTLHASAHCLRHIEQIEEILANEGFPKL